MEPDAVEIRVLGCLIEKQRTTPDVYPLTLNALRLACNQSTNRDPVVDYDESTIRAAIDRLVAAQVGDPRELGEPALDEVPAHARRRARARRRRDLRCSPC